MQQTAIGKLILIKKFPTLITLKRHTAGPYIEAVDSILTPTPY
jgi:hypothetical protein